MGYRTVQNIPGGLATTDSYVWEALFDSATANASVFVLASVPIGQLMNAYRIAAGKAAVLAFIRIHVLGYSLSTAQVADLDYKKITRDGILSFDGDNWYVPGNGTPTPLLNPDQDITFVGSSVEELQITSMELGGNNLSKQLQVKAQVPDNGGEELRFSTRITLQIMRA